MAALHGANREGQEPGARAGAGAGVGASHSRGRSIGAQEHR